MKRHILLAASFVVACSGSPDKKSDAPPADTAQSDLAACEAAAEAVRQRAEAFQTMPLGGRDAMETTYLEFQQSLAEWEADDSPCTRDGSDVTKRMMVKRDTTLVVEEAEAEGTKRMVEHLAANIDESRELLKTVFGTGRDLPDGAVDAAVEVERAYRKRLLSKFQETGKYGQLDDELSTTCVFGTREIDPNAEKITDNFRFVITGTVDVHALCRIPAPAEKFAGDPDGKFVIVLDDDDDPSNGVVHEGDLGSPEKWGSTQWFSGRFSMPQGAYAQKDSGYYYVWIKAVRPELGDETLVHNWFYWNR